MENEDLITAFEHYLAGKASPGEVRQMLNYFQMEKESKLLFDLVLKEMEKPVFLDAAALENRQPAYRRVKNALDVRIDSEKQAVVISTWRKTLYRVAAAAAILIALGTAWILWKPHSPQMIVVNVPFGQLKEIKLPDGSEVWLNAGSEFEYPNVFKDKIRGVRLREGQAIFQVVHNMAHPFKVNAGRLTVTVLGTSFEVRDFNKERDAKVTVITGKVSVTQLGSNNFITLLPKEQAVLHHSDNSFTKTTVHSDVSAWKDNQLVFDNESLDNIFGSLERKYKVHFIINNAPLLHETTSMKLGNQPLSDVLTVLSFSEHFSYRYANDSTIIIK